MLRPLEKWFCNEKGGGGGKPYFLLFRAKYAAKLDSVTQ